MMQTTKLRGKIGPVTLHFDNVGYVTKGELIRFFIFFTVLNLIIVGLLVWWFISCLLAVIAFGPTFWPIVGLILSGLMILGSVAGNNSN